MHTTSPTLLDKLRDPARRHDAMVRFVRLYTPLLLGCAKKRGVPDPEDAVQEVMLQLVKALPTYQHTGQRGAFRAWLLKIARNKGEDQRTRRATRREAGGPDPHDVRDHRDAVWDLIEQEDRERGSQLVRRGLEVIRRDFSDQTWQAFERVAIHGRQPAAVADELNMQRTAVYLARYRVLARLREELDGHID